MKTTEFFKEIKKVAKDSSLESVFAYRISPDKTFYEIVLHSEPSKRVQNMCVKNGFSIKQNIMHVNEGGEMVAHTIWDILPINVDEIEYKTNDDVFISITPNAIVASDQAMIDAGLIKCNPREDTITLWTYELNSVWNEMQWTPIMRVFTKPLEEDIKDEEGRVIEHKSTHKIGAFYGALVYGDFDFTRFLEKRNVPFEKL